MATCLSTTILFAELCMSCVHVGPFQYMYNVAQAKRNMQASMLLFFTAAPSCVLFHFVHFISGVS